MKKVIAVMMMVIIVIVYYLSMKNMDTTSTVDNKPQKETETYGKIIKIKDELTESYPDSARGVIEAHNKLMEIGYSKEMDDEAVTEYTNALRLLYAKRLNELNPVQDQINKFIAERLENEGNPLIIIENEILDVTISKNDKGENEAADISVVHSTNAGQIKRKYYLVMEDSKWKIQSWETEKEEQSNETNVEE